MNEVSDDIQRAKYAGTFYPKNPENLRKYIKPYEGDIESQFPTAPKMFIMPHAGYRFCGDVARQVANELRGEQISRVVILSPSHFKAFNGIVRPPKSTFETPIGNLNVERTALKRTSKLDFMRDLPEAFENEYGIEVILPWVRANLPGVRIAPFVVGNVSDEDMATFLEAIWGNNQTIIIVSTDLSHFHNLEQAQRLDFETAKSIETLRWQDINKNSACGYVALRGILRMAHRRRMRARRIAASNSSLITNDTDRVVGYGGWVFHSAKEAKTSKAHADILYNIAASAIANKLNIPHVQKYLTHMVPTPLETIMASFVSLEADGQLNGCIGSLVASQPLAKNVQENALKAAFTDRRFTPVTPETFDKMECEISLLSQPITLKAKSRDEVISKFKPNTTGVTVTYGSQRATLLPNVWEKVPEPEEFLKLLFAKCRLPDNFWSDELEFQTYTSERLPKTMLANA